MPMVWVEDAYVDLFVHPAIHAEGLDFGDVGAELPVDGCTSHTEKNAQLEDQRQC